MPPKRHKPQYVTGPCKHPEEALCVDKDGLLFCQDCFGRWDRVTKEPR